MFLNGLKSIFGREMKDSNFQPKIDPGGQKYILDKKIESSVFRPKLTHHWALEVSNQFLVEK